MRGCDKTGLWITISGKIKTSQNGSFGCGKKVTKHPEFWNRPVGGAVRRKQKRLASCGAPGGEGTK